MIRETDRLILRRFKKEDAARVTELLKDGKVQETTQNIADDYTEQMALDWISLHDVWFANKHRYELAVVLKETNELIGVVGLSNVDKVGELGYWFGYEYWNKGFGTEAAQALLHYAFLELEYERIYARYIVTNIGSKRVMEKLNMTYEGTLRKHMFKNEKYVDVGMFAILKEEYFED